MKADLSVIIPNKDKDHSWINECIESVKEQTIEPKEIIFIDDGSKERVSHPDSISIILPENKGVAYARDVGARLSTGRLLLFLDSDDKLAPDFIERCGEFIKDSDIVYSDFIMTGNVERNRLVSTPKKLTPQLLMSKECPVRVTSMMKREVYTTLNGFKDLPVFEDWDFYLRAMFNGYTFARANTYFMYRKTGKGRINQPDSVKEKVYKDITSLYTIKKGKLCLTEKP